MNFPNNVKYTEEHEWIRVEGDIAYVGIDRKSTRLNSSHRT